MVPFDSADSVQSALLAAIRRGESSRKSNPAWRGVGDVDLVACPRSPTGFPLWSGWGKPVSHAAGLYQFQPGTWTPYAQKYGLNFANPNDQAAAAWYLAQDVCARKALNLVTALHAKDFMSIQRALLTTWTSVGGSKATPGLAATLKDSLGG